MKIQTWKILKPGELTYVHITSTNVTTISSPRIVEGVSLECLVVAGEHYRMVGKVLADGGADTSVIGTGWRMLHQTKRLALIQGFSDDLKSRTSPLCLL